MKLRTTSQPGFETVMALVLVLVVSVVGFAGYKVWTNNHPGDSTTSVGSSRAVVPETITTTADLQATNHALDNSASQLDAGLSDSSLDADLNSML